MPTRLLRPRSAGGSYELKPELVAPGVEIVATRAAGTQIGVPVDEHYVVASGTSMATPHAAGAAAILAQQHPDWTADQIKRALIASSDPVDGDGYDVGAGRVDIGVGIDTVVQPDHDVVDVTLDDPRSEPHLETVTWTETSHRPSRSRSSWKTGAAMRSTPTHLAVPTRTTCGHRLPCTPNPRWST